MYPKTVKSYCASPVPYATTSSWNHKMDETKRDIINKHNIALADKNDDDADDDDDEDDENYDDTKEDLSPKNKRTKYISGSLNVSSKKPRVGVMWIKW